MERWRVSTGGGHQPHWNPSGKELFFLVPDWTLLAAAIEEENGAFRWRAPAPSSNPLSWIWDRPEDKLADRVVMDTVKEDAPAYQRREE